VFVYSFMVGVTKLSASLCYIASNGGIINEWCIGNHVKRNGRGLSQRNIQGLVATENHETHQSGKLVSQPGLEPGTSRKQDRSFTASVPISNFTKNTTCFATPHKSAPPPLLATVFRDKKLISLL
jgi:hypothetical protein